MMATASWLLCLPMGMSIYHTRPKILSLMVIKVLAPLFDGFLEQLFETD